MELPIDSYDEYDYAELNVFIAFFLQAFRASIGDIATPSYDYW